MLADRYCLVSLLGRGAMGEVYSAEDLRLGQTVALKFLPEPLTHDLDARERLFAETRNARSIAHPNVCRVYDIGEMNGRVFLTMEYIDGEDLALLLRRIGRLPGPKALEIAQQLCLALAAAHERGILHRDLKPSNVMIDGRGRVRVTDFGLAINADRDRSPADFSGTIPYMSPERLRGAPASVQSDLYALGLILYEVFTGQRAFQASASSLEDWQKLHDSSSPARPSTLSMDVDAATERAILRCLAKDPARRPASAAAVAASLPGGDPIAAALAAGETPSPALVAASGAEGSLSRRLAWGLFAACAISLALVTVAAGRRSLVNMAPFEASPDVLRARARSMLQELGYTDAPGDHAWWINVDAEQRAYLATKGPIERRFQSAARAVPSPLSFWYRQSPQAFRPLDVSGSVTRNDPAPVVATEAVVRLDSHGRLIDLRVTPAPIESRGASAPKEPDWSPVIAFADLRQVALDAATPRWVPPTAFDTRRAWAGMLDDAPVRLEAAALDGRIVFARRGGPWDESDAEPISTGAGPATQQVMAVLWIMTLAAAGLLARHNLKLGRGDRKGAQRVAVFVLIAGSIASVFGRHWMFDPEWIWTVISTRLSTALFDAAVVWVFYLGLEPLARRAWPHLLIGWTRLIDGRWRDPLVGQALLAGVLFGTLAPIVATLPEAAGEAWRLEGAQPYFQTASLMPGSAYFSNMVALLLKSVKDSVGIVAFMVVARFALRNTYAVLTATAAVATLAAVSGAQPFGLDMLQAAIVGVASIWFVRRYGLLALAVGLAINHVVRATPWTFDQGDWFAWRVALTVLLTLGVAAWGFLNVLGRQSVLLDPDLER